MDADTFKWLLITVVAIMLTVSLVIFFWARKDIKEESRAWWEEHRKKGNHED